MNYYVLERSDSSRDLYLADNGVTRATQVNGINPSTVRKVFDDIFGNGQASLDLVTVGSASAELTGLMLPDLLYWSWVPAFSKRAHDLMLDLGAIPSDFSHCQIGSHPDSYCFLHLPLRSYNTMDIAHSRFKFAIPTEPPIPYGLQQLTMTVGTKSMPHCFRLEIPGTTQVLGELLVSEEFQTQWVNRQLTGAEFRCVSQ
jgi:hypothetical protein